MAKRSRKDFHALLEEAGHVLIRNEGEIDIWQMNYDIHNGPGCAKCGQSWCHHCQKEITSCEGK